ncbi:MAG TPA: hypothetical protein VIH11_02370 [Gemmatimonadaceae bacterium]|nr:hypothetical protein [Gemmatimonadaceae bacterium]
MPTRTGSAAGRAARIVIFALLALGTLSAGRCHGVGGEEQNLNAFEWSGPLQAPGVVHLRNTNGPIEVTPSDDDRVHVVADVRWRRGDPAKDLRFPVVTEGSSLTVCVLWTSGTCSASRYTMRSDFWSKLFGRRGTDANVKLTVRVPARVGVNALTVNGAVRIAATAPVKARTTNGSIEVGTAVGPVDAVTVNGDVDVRMTTLGGDGPVRAVTVNGTSSAFLPETFDGDVKLGTLNGRVGSDFAISVVGEGARANHLNGTVGAGGRVVEVTNVNGSAWLRKLNADGTVAGTIAVTGAGAATTAPAKAPQARPSAAKKSARP